MIFQRKCRRIGVLLEFRYFDSQNRFERNGQECVSSDAGERNDGADDDCVVSFLSQFAVEGIENEADSRLGFFAKNEFGDAFSAGKKVGETADSKFHQTIVIFSESGVEEINDTMGPWSPSLH